MKKILIADDNISHLLILKKTLTQHGYEVLTARNGREALEKLEHETVDCVLTDWMMPEMDGIELIRRIKEGAGSAPVTMVVSALVSDDARRKAIETGADEYFTKPYDTEAILGAIGRLTAAAESRSNVRAPIPANSQERPPYIGIAVAASTGGPDTLLRFFSVLPVLSDAALFVVLHGPAWMLKTMVGQIQKKTSMTVRLAEEGMKTRAGEIYLAPGDRHMTVCSQALTLALTDDPPINYVKPAADPLFRSVAIAFGKYSMGIVMTGMGHDGAVGCGYIAAAGGVVIVQDPLTALIDSMPQSVVSLGLAGEIAAIAEMPAVILRRLHTMSTA